MLKKKKISVTEANYYASPQLQIEEEKLCDNPNSTKKHLIKFSTHS